MTRKFLSTLMSFFDALLREVCLQFFIAEKCVFSTGTPQAFFVSSTTHSRRRGRSILFFFFRRLFRNWNRSAVSNVSHARVASSCFAKFSLTTRGRDYGILAGARHESALSASPLFLTHRHCHITWSSYKCSIMRANKR